MTSRLLTSSLVLVIIGSFCGSALADGAFIWRKGADLHEPSQKAIILHKDGVQEMVLQVKYSGPAEEFCWLVPVPSTPKLQTVDPDVFAELSLYTQQRRRWGKRQGDVPSVEVVERKRVGIFDTAVLKSTDAKAIQQWLTKHGFEFPANRQDVLEFYARKEWVFSAIRIDQSELTADIEAKLHEGTLQPLLFTFTTKEIVYPLYISSVNAGTTQLLLFVLSDMPVFHPWCATDNAPVWATAHLRPKYDMGRRFTEAWDNRAYYRRVTAEELPKCRAILKRMKDDRWFLTRLDGLFTPEMMVDDLTIRPDPGQDTLKAVAPFVTRVRIMYAIGAAGGGNYAGLGDTDRNAAVGLTRANNEVHSHVYGRQGMSGMFKLMEDDPIPSGWDRGKLHLRPAWIERLDAYERQCLLRSALMLHRRLVAQRASSSDPDQATLYYRQIDKAAMKACCHVLGKSVPEYNGWDSYQRHWQVIEDALAARKKPGQVEQKNRR